MGKKKSVMNMPKELCKKKLLKDKQDTKDKKQKAESVRKKKKMCGYTKGDNETILMTGL